MLMTELLKRLRENLRGRIRNGELTERGLARKTGLSQSHMHNVLKGARMLTPEVADQILQAMRMSILDLMGEEIREGKLPRRGAGRERQEIQPASRATSR